MDQRDEWTDRLDLAWLLRSNEEHAHLCRECRLEWFSGACLDGGCDFGAKEPVVCPGCSRDALEDFLSRDREFEEMEGYG